jgi:hypothetical protein
MFDHCSAAATLDWSLCRHALARTDRVDLKGIIDIRRDEELAVAGKSDR